MKHLHHWEREECERIAADVIIERIQRLAEKQEYVVLGLPGGSSVSGVLERLARDKRIPWKQVHIFMIDERLVPITSGMSNFHIIKLFLIDKSENRIPPRNLHPFVVNNMTEDYGLREYTKEFFDFGGKFDIILFRAGSDGHIAGLFPRSPSFYDDREQYILVTDSPRPPTRRISASRQMLLKAGLAVLVILGRGKEEVVTRFNDAKLDSAEVPVKLIEQIKDSYMITNIKPD